MMNGAMLLPRQILAVVLRMSNTIIRYSRICPWKGWMKPAASGNGTMMKGAISSSVPIPWVATTTFEYTDGLLSTVTAAAGAVTVMEYDTDHNL